MGGAACGSAASSRNRTIGSGRIADGVVGPLDDMRHGANALWEKKLASFGK